MEKEIKTRLADAGSTSRGDIPTFHLTLETESERRIRVQIQDNAPDGLGKSIPEHTDSPVCESCRNEVDLGHTLYNALFIGEIGRRFEEYRRASGSGGGTESIHLRLLLEIEASPTRSDPLFNLPWELLHDGQGFLTLDHRISIARRPILVRRDVERIQAPLRVLLTYAEPQGLAGFDGETYLREIEQALNGTELLDLRLLPHATRTSLQQAIAEGAHFFHFLGHGDIEIASHLVMGRLYLENPDTPGLADVLTSTTLQDWMSKAQIRPTLAVFTTCRSGNTDHAPTLGVAQSLLYTGVSAVVGMQADIYIQEAREFAAAFYRALAERATVDDAMQAGRKALNRLRLSPALRHGTETVVQRMLDLQPEIPCIRYVPSGSSSLSARQEQIKKAVPFPAWAVPVLFLQGDGWLGQDPPKPVIRWKVVEGNRVYEEKEMVYVEESRFYVDKYPVTCEEYQYFVEATGRCWRNPWEHLKKELDHWEKLPATNVTLEDALAYARWAGKHLPTPDEWQQAALAGCRDKQQKYPWGDEFLAGRCNSREGRLRRPWPVIESEARYGANPAGVCDVVGNVAEWVAVIEEGKIKQAVLCGGSFSDPKEHCTVLSRSTVDSPRYASPAVGFRCVASWAEVIAQSVPDLD